MYVDRPQGDDITTTIEQMQCGLSICLHMFMVDRFLGGLTCYRDRQGVRF